MATQNNATTCTEGPGRQGCIQRVYRACGRKEKGRQTELQRHCQTGGLDPRKHGESNRWYNAQPDHGAAGQQGLKGRTNNFAFGGLTANRKQKTNGVPSVCKHATGNPDFDLLPDLIETYKKKDFGPYAQDGELWVCFTGSNHYCVRTWGISCRSREWKRKGHLNNKLINFLQHMIGFQSHVKLVFMKSNYFIMF